MLESWKHTAMLSKAVPLRFFIALRVSNTVTECPLCTEQARGVHEDRVCQGWFQVSWSYTNNNKTLLPIIQFLDLESPQFVKDEE